MIRLKLLNAFDEFLNWSVSKQLREYPVPVLAREHFLTPSSQEVQQFSEKYAFFSSPHPLIAKVTTDPKDLEPVLSLLKTLYEEVSEEEYFEIAVAEVLTKVLVYRDLKVGQRVDIPILRNQERFLEPFVVDKVFDLWHGMPAFGLIPKREGVASLLLFRGTDLTLTSRRGLASLFSDMDREGAGLFVFKRAREEISHWLKKVANLGKKARVMGFSLGGAFAAYTFLYENTFLSDELSLAFCGPGFTDKMLLQWNTLPKNRQKEFVSYLNAGDVVPKVGHPFGIIYCLSTSVVHKPLKAHTLLMCGEPLIRTTLVHI